jgi:putative transposase
VDGALGRAVARSSGTFGDHQAVKRRYYRWIERGALDRFLAALTTEADLEWLMIDSTIVRAPSTRPGHGLQKAQGLGRSRGGLSTKIHAATDALGNPVRLLLGPGQRNDITQAHDLIEGFEAQAVIADKGYDADHLRKAVLASDAIPVIPSKSNRRAPIDCDKALYKERNLVERFFNKLKQFRRVATRYDKLLANYRGFVILAAITILLK